MNVNLGELEIWFVTGSQHLYGDDVLKSVAEHATAIARGLSEAGDIPVKVVCKPIVTTPDAILAVCLEANNAARCIGVITWMHTFSPARMWIAGLKALQKPLLHLHTQYNQDLPWSEIDMDFMNLNQSAHGDREYGFIGSRMHVSRKVVVGYWQDVEVQRGIGTWARAAAGWHDWQGARIARFGDNMREVAVTEGDKVEAQIRLGYAVNGYGVGDLVARVDQVADADIEALVRRYDEEYVVAESLRRGGSQREGLRDAARIELGMRAFLEEGGFKAFTTTFQDLHGLPQLPGLAVQRLMADGYGFGAEGDWKTAALVRAMKVMGDGLDGGTAFMEDYTYHFGGPKMKVLGAHMLEVCPSIAAGKPSLEMHPLSIGDKSDPARLVFDVRSGPALNATILDMGNRFRMLVNEVDVVPPDQPLPKLPVARVVWEPRPNLKTAAAAWIYAGGAHHNGFSQVVTAEHLEDFSEMAGIEFMLIGKDTELPAFRRDLRLNELYYGLSLGR